VTMWKRFDGRTARVFVSSIAMCALAFFSACQKTKSIDDAAITKGVKTKLAAAFGPIEDRQVSQFDRGANGQTITYISVSSIGGVVTLTGEVGSKRAKAKAGEIARSVRQVSRVNNNLSLAPGYSDDAVGGQP
jgi:BON domain